MRSLMEERSCELCGSTEAVELVCRACSEEAVCLISTPSGDAAKLLDELGALYRPEYCTHVSEEPEFIAARAAAAALKARAEHWRERYKELEGIDALLNKQNKAFHSQVELLITCLEGAVMHIGELSDNVYHEELCEKFDKVIAAAREAMK